jgi:hypothetical protein
MTNWSQCDNGHDADAARPQLVPNTPGSNFGWKIEGRVVIQEAGSYSVCTTSHDG